MNTPKNLNYSIVKPVGYPSQIKYEKFTPISFNTSNSGVSSQDVVRFNISSQGFWDPYSAYIKIEVDCSQMDGTLSTTTGNRSIGSLQLDNSAQSFINQLIIWRSGSELERIENYDIIAAMLNDIHGSNDNRAVRSFEGMNGQNIPQGQQYTNQNKFSHVSGAVSTTGLRQTGYNPLLNISLLTGILVDDQSLNTDQTVAPVNLYNRYEYTLCNEAKNSIQTTKPTQYSQNGLLQLSTANLGETPYNGYQQAFCPSLSSYGNEPLFSKNIPQLTTYKGKLGQYIYSDRQTFCIPLISGFLGVLMPMESYRYIPMKYLQDLQLEFRLSPHALFTSGYNDPSDGKTGTALTALTDSSIKMLQRSWRITKFELNVEMQYFEEPILSIILSKIYSSEGIVLHTNSWQSGPTFPIPANQGPNGSYAINLLYESIKTVIFCFIPDDYINYTFCRKQYRISHNITNFYVKIGSDYYPPLPITGHAGTAAGYSSVNNDYDANNSEFLVNLYKAFGKYNDIQANSIINNINFAVNNRAYDPTNTKPLYTAAVSGPPAIAPFFSNLDTTMSLPLFHENRCVGRSIFAFDLETVNQDPTVMSGLNTSLKGKSPWEITVKSDTVNAFPRASTMYTFCQYDLLIQLKENISKIYGKN